MIGTPPKYRRNTLDFSRRMVRTNLYKDERTGKLLLVPTDDMWLVHEASTPAAILKRSGSQPRTWDSWKAKHRKARPWLFDWLYDYRGQYDSVERRDIRGQVRPLVTEQWQTTGQIHEKLEEPKPARASVIRALAQEVEEGYFEREHNIKGRDIRWRKAANNQPPAELFVPTKQMRSFRDQASVQKIADAAKRSQGQLKSMEKVDRYCESVSPTLICYWLHKYQEYPWFERWLLRGESPPTHVTIATPGQIRCFRHGMNYIGHLARATKRGIGLDTYAEWFRTGRISDLGWLRWLYGDPSPKGAFVVDLGLQRLRAEKSLRSRLKRAGINTTILKRWKEDTKYAKAFQETVQFVSRSGRKRQTPDSEAWKRLPSRVNLAMLRFAKVSSLVACCERARIGEQTYCKAIREAGLLRVERELLQYLDLQEPFDVSKPNLSGLIAKNLFVPTESMFAFRNVAGRAMTDNKVWQLRSLPCFDQWFADWALPGPKRGRRVTMIGKNETAVTNGEASGNAKDLFGEIIHVYGKHVTTHRTGGKRTTEGPVVKAPKRSTERGEGRMKLIAALTKHHQYADGGCLNLTPIGNNELARQAVVADSTVSDFFSKHFGGWGEYRAACNRNAQEVAIKLAILNGDARKKGLATFGRNPPGEGKREDAHDE